MHDKLKTNEIAVAESGDLSFREYIHVCLHAGITESEQKGAHQM